MAIGFLSNKLSTFKLCRYCPLDLWCLMLGRYLRSSSNWLYCGKLCFFPLDICSILYLIFEQNMFIYLVSHFVVQTQAFSQLWKIFFCYFFDYSFISLFSAFFPKIPVTSVLASRICPSCLIYSVTSFCFPSEFRENFSSSHLLR